MSIVLASPDTELIRFPGGEWHIKSKQRLNGEERVWVLGASADDLIGLALWADAVHRDGGIPSAVIPYLPGARQDRRRHGEALSCKVYADLINSCDLDAVICLDPHSDVMPALINRCHVEPIAPIVAKTVAGKGYTAILAPDAGAAKRAQAVADLLGLPLYQASKKRDPSTGKLSGFACPALYAGQYLVVDDICDGGGTFMGLAAASGLHPSRLGLWVTHGIFSDGAEKLPQAYSAIYTTDSHPIVSASYYPQFTKILHTVELMPLLKETQWAHSLSTR
jgi:ribose-phosphate pyrophosphokinase